MLTIIIKRIYTHKIIYKQATYEIHELFVVELLVERDSKQSDEQDHEDEWGWMAQLGLTFRKIRDISDFSARIQEGLGEAAPQNFKTLL